LAHLTNCKSMLEAFKAGGDFHSRTAMNMYQHVPDAVEEKKVLLEWHPQPGQDKPPVPLLKDAFGAERRKAKMLNFSIAYGKTAVGLSQDWNVWASICTGLCMHLSYSLVQFFLLGFILFLYTT
jgi:DNA polymerase-1